jgi:hypothetical protein
MLRLAERRPLITVIFSLNISFQVERMLRLSEAETAPFSERLSEA